LSRCDSTPYAKYPGYRIAAKLNYLDSAVDAVIYTTGGFYSTSLGFHTYAQIICRQNIMCREICSAGSIGMSFKTTEFLGVLQPSIPTGTAVTWLLSKLRSHCEHDRERVV
jgi:hypothetical protein